MQKAPLCSTCQTDSSQKPVNVVCTRMSYVGFLPAGLQQLVVVVLSHRRVHVCELGRGVLQHVQGLRGIPFIQGLVDQSDGSNTCKYTSRRTERDQLKLCESTTAA